MIKKGDTLVEVTLAVGIFSMIAIAVVAVMSNGTSESQTALETTLAREEIDTQVEALRFIQAAAIKETSGGKYRQLWDKLVENANLLDDGQSEANKRFLQFTPATCDELYDNNNEDNIVLQNAFIINTRALGLGRDKLDRMYLRATADDSSRLVQAEVYPRILYTQSEEEDPDSGAPLYDEDITKQNAIYQAEGIFIVAVRDKSTTNIVRNGNVERVPAFYDFYVRTCWYGSNADRPSTISTVIRLFDPTIGVTDNSTPNGD